MLVAVLLIFMLFPVLVFLLGTNAFSITSSNHALNLRRLSDERNRVHKITADEIKSRFGAAPLDVPHDDLNSAVDNPNKNVHEAEITQEDKNSLEHLGDDDDGLARHASDDPDSVEAKKMIARDHSEDEDPALLHEAHDVDRDSSKADIGDSKRNRNSASSNDDKPDDQKIHSSDDKADDGKLVDSNRGYTHKTDDDNWEAPIINVDDDDKGLELDDADAKSVKLDTSKKAANIKKDKIDGDAPRQENADDHDTGDSENTELDDADIKIQKIARAKISDDDIDDAPIDKKSVHDIDAGMSNSDTAHIEV